MKSPSDSLHVRLTSRYRQMETVVGECVTSPKRPLTVVPVAMAGVDRNVGKPDVFHCVCVSRTQITALRVSDFYNIFLGCVPNQSLILGRSIKGIDTTNPWERTKEKKSSRLRVLPAEVSLIRSDFFTLPCT